MAGQDYELYTQAIELAERWQNKANELLTKDEKKLQKQLKRLLTHPQDKVLFSKLIDQSFRSHIPRRVADQITDLLSKEGVPSFLSPVEKAFIRIFQQAGRQLASVAVPTMISQMRQGSSRAIIPGESDKLKAHLEKRKQEKVRMNINHLGEAVLGEDEAEKRLETYVKDMRDPAIECISIKISTIYSQISSLAMPDTIQELKKRLTSIYTEAQHNCFTRADGSRVPKFVNLDMEEYRDLEITYHAFVETLDQPELLQYSGGIVLQAYLPDSFAMQQKLTQWARARLTKGGAPVQLRIVKGANMEMEKLESALFNWPLAPYDNKLEVDANYKRMVTFGMKEENIKAVRLGIASHNLFELAYAYTLARANGVTDYFHFEMLEGMADHVRRALQEISGEVLLYAPVASRDEFINAIAYLIRRLDENTAPENFLRYSPDLHVGSNEWDYLKQQFLDSCLYQARAQDHPNRIQDRENETFIPEEVSAYHTGRFVNEPDTDWSLPANRNWAENIRATWCKQQKDEPFKIPLVIGGKQIFTDRDTRDVIDPNRVQEKILVASHAQANAQDAETAIQVARQDPDGWRQMSYGERHRILAGVAMEIRHARGDLIGAAAADTGKVFSEADVEVSEAIDFAEYYPFTASKFADLEHMEAKGKGVGLVISPWNFPIAIPCGGIVTALAAGNTVIFKPASDAVMTAWMLCQCFWRAGVSKNVLQFIPCSGAKVGPLLTGSPDIDCIILTGGTDTGLQILKQTPGVYLAAETGGKNATIVTDMADRDQAIKNVIHSAFSNCGQKCSATSLLILEKTIYDDPHFRQQLVDASRSMKVGSAWDFGSKLGPLIKAPANDLKQALTTLEPGEEWALEPRMVDDNPAIWAPCIKYGVQPGSYTHMTEFFGPLLGVMRAENLEHAIQLVNQTGYGLTSGIETLDEREQEVWKEHIFAGNLYINRGTTGAIVLRQPFGGMGKSALGPGIKAGSPDYVAQFMDFTETGYPATGALKKDSRLIQLAQEWKKLLQWNKLQEHKEDIHKLISTIYSYTSNMDNFFGLEQDFFHLRGQDNILRYLPITPMVIRAHHSDSLFEILARLAAAAIAGCVAELSIPEELDTQANSFLGTIHGKQFLADTLVVRESDATLAARLHTVGRVRYAATDRVPETIFAQAAKTGLYISRTPVYMEGRLELLQYFQQQAICNNYHRYGNLGNRSFD
ncbi:bifunctional proline dehydrogenase/L-glutamate gamma-semialdehyde dehydrogenase [Desulfogranum japonicum]|uniref:bifunctional proline dehydrogenase/L-glutamate gamma-semialdehyde dehydrogenase n=1 Tax=Desulfogranum japonicum TaxID=231447 RepID=UPI0003F7125E|nr:bifunctional proline dehydrogenase/L-glutamate gamma-semialdehyde dehydrogenase [Desulfogranum japonicum]